MAVFLLFVAPGICYELLRGRTLLPREESTFEQISRVLLAGTLIAALALALLSLARWISSDGLLNISELLIRGTSHVAGHPVLVGWTALVQLALSTLLAIAFADLRTSQSSRRIYQADAWHALCEHVASPGQKVKLSVHLKSGRDITGYYVGASTELEPAKRELILGAPISVREAGASKSGELDPGWQRMVIAGSEIESLTASYVGPTAPVPPMPVTWPVRFRNWVSQNYLSWQTSAISSVILLILTVLV